MKTVEVKTGRPYNILIEHGIIDHAGDYIRPLTKAIRAVIISDTNVSPIYSQRVKNSLEKSGFDYYAAQAETNISLWDHYNVMPAVVKFNLIGCALPLDGTTAPFLAFCLPLAFNFSSQLPTSG